MVIECPYCSTRFRVEERRLRGHALLKCSHCTRVFPIPRREGAPPAPRAKPPRREPENLSFPFDDDDWRAQAPDELDLSAEQFTLNVDPSPTAAGTTHAPAGFSSSDVVPDDDEWVEQDDDLERDVDDEDEAEDADDDTAALERGGDEDEGAVASTPLKPLFVFLTIVVAGYAMLAWTLRTNPAWTASVTRSLPIVGDEVAAAQLKQNVALEDLRGRYERTKEGKLVFLITGRAVNHSDELLANLRIQLGLLDGDQRHLDQQTTICGNPVRVELIRELSIDQVAILKGIKPLDDIEVQAGGSCPLVSIFLDVAQGVATFSAEVVSAQRQT